MPMQPLALPLTTASRGNTVDAQGWRCAPPLMQLKKGGGFPAFFSF